MIISVKNKKLDGIFNVIFQGELAKVAGATLSAFNVIGNRVRVICEEGDIQKSQSHIKKILLDFRASGSEIDTLDIPNLIPLLLIVSCFSCSNTTLKNACNYENIQDLIKEITKIGGDFVLNGKDILVKGHAGLKGGETVNAKDEKILLSLVLSAPFMENKIKISCLDEIFEKVNPYFLQLKNCGLKLKIEN